MIVDMAVLDTDGFVGTRDYNGIHFKVLGRRAVERYVPTQREVVISITDLESKLPQLSEDFEDYLYLQFDDCAEQPRMRDMGYDLTAEDASRIVEFVMKHLHDKDKIVIHCFAGISRSRSVAAALADGLQLPFKFTVKNPYVYRAIKEKLAQGV